MPRVLGVIPSRYASKRFPGKPLALIKGKPMVAWVYRQAKKAIKDVVVATDDKRIYNAVQKFGGSVLLTPRQLKSGTDRMAYVARRKRADYYVNVQGDEPTIDPANIRKTVALALKHKAISTAAVPLKGSHKKDPHVVKVVLDKEGQALYFSRSLIPSAGPALKHVGLYVYPRKSLLKFAALKPSALEKAERLEQLRALSNQIPIFVARVSKDSIGVDTPADLRQVQRLIKETR